jgi:DNA-binding response OmpR family regulator
MDSRINPSLLPTRALLLIDRSVLANLVKFTLNHGLFDTRVVQTPEEASALLPEWPPHVAIIDMDIANGEVLERLGYVTPRTDRVPSIALTRRGDLRTKLQAFERGIDDILTVPFSPEELVARALAVMRRTYHDSAAFSSVIRQGDLEIDMLNRCLRVGSTDLHLTSLEQSLLYLLAANAGHLLTRDEILDSLWGVDYAAESNVVDRHIRNLRAKLQNDHRNPRYIATVPGKGYLFVPTMDAACPAS